MSVRDPGYLKFWKNTEDEKLLPSLAVGQRLDFRDVKIDERVTEPPLRYTEPRLVQAMERSGIGRPSTYASTVTTLKDREYVRLEKQFLVPTELGLATDEALGRALPELVDVRFTARMEAELDAIAEGKLGWQRFVCRWNREWFEPAVARARQALGGTRRRGSPAPALAVEKTERAVAKARKSGGVPVCPQGHGELGLRPTRKGGLYWRCPQEGCDRFAWYVELSTEKCPECRQPLEKVPSAKVAGGYFLKCARPDRHAREIVLFKDRRTRRWQRAGRRPDLK
jgi:DNA topoisomerase-1